MRTCLVKQIQIYRKETSSPKRENFPIKNSDIFHISPQNIDCGHLIELSWRGSSNKYPQSVFLSRNKKNNAYPCKPQFDWIKVGFKRVKIIYSKTCVREPPSRLTLNSG